MTTNLWWAYDEESGSFSALPASPLLLPCIGLFFLLAVFSKIRGQPNSGFGTGSIPVGLDEQMFNKYKQRYKEIIAILSMRELTEDERHELRLLQKPPWAKPGEVWTY